MEKLKCSICKEYFDDSDLYEYRGAIACSEHFDQLQERRDGERQQIIDEENHKTERFRGLNLSDDAIGKANREILKTDIEIASKESKRIKDYEGR